MTTSAVTWAARTIVAAVGLAVLALLPAPARGAEFGAPFAVMGSPSQADVPGTAIALGRDGTLWVADVQPPDTTNAVRVSAHRAEHSVGFWTVSPSAGLSAKSVQVVPSGSAATVCARWPPES